MRIGGSGRPADPRRRDEAGAAGEGLPAWIGRFAEEIHAYMTERMRHHGRGELGGDVMEIKTMAGEVRRDFARRKKPGVGRAVLCCLGERRICL